MSSHKDSPQLDVTDVRFCDRAAYVPSIETLIAADLHYGRARTARLEAPLDEVVQIRERLLALVDRFDPTRLVLAGDILDAFDTVPPGVVDRVTGLLTDLAETGVSCTVLRGNHDTMLDSVFDGEIEDAVTIGETVIAHGHEPLETVAPRYVIGHEHPSIRIEGDRHPCYLYGQGVYRGADVFVLPPFTKLVRGTIVNFRSSQDCHAPLLRQTDLGAFRPIVRDEAGDETLSFPPLHTLRSFL